MCHRCKNLNKQFQTCITRSLILLKQQTPEEDINHLQSKILEVQDADTALTGGVEQLIKLKTVPKPSSEVNDYSIVKQDGLLN